MTDPPGDFNDQMQGVEGVTVNLATPSAPTRSDHGLLLLLALCGAVLAGGIGLAVGLNVHPPDQHELEKGYQSGFRDGQKKGHNTGYVAGEAAVEKKLAAVVRDRDSGMRRLQELCKEEQRIALVDAKALCANRIDKAKAEAYDRGQVDIEAELTAAHDATIATTRAEFQAVYHKRKAQLEKGAYHEGLLAGGYQEGYDKGIEQGVERGHRDCLNDCDARVAGVKVDAKQLGYEEGLEAGDRVGFRRGKDEGKRLGYADGFEKGDRAGYQRGYNDGWKAAGGK